MGCIVNIKGCMETVLDRERDLEDLIGSYIGIDARDMYHEILQGYKDQLEIKTEDAAESEDRVNRLENTIEEGRYNIFQILDDLNGEVDLADFRRRLKNIAWELDY